MNKNRVPVYQYRGKNVYHSVEMSLKHCSVEMMSNEYKKSEKLFKNLNKVIKVSSIHLGNFILMRRKFKKKKAFFLTYTF